MKASWKDLAQQRFIPHFKGYELLVMHDMVKWIAGFVIRGKLWDHEPSWGLVVDVVRDERRGEHVIQSLIDRVRETLIC